MEEVFRLGTFAPASVQRDYQWRTSHCLTLLNDIDRTFLTSSFAPAVVGAAPADAEADTDALDADLSGLVAVAEAVPLEYYMLGAIVLNGRTAAHHAIYDGLQRLTTLTILICVLRDLTRDEILAARLDALVRADSGITRIVLAGRDTTLATQIQPRGAAIKNRRAQILSDMGKRIRTASQAFREKLKPWDRQRRDTFARFLLEQVYLDVQQAFDPRLARQIFVTTNTRGRSLDAIDLFKGQLTDIAADETTAAQVVGHWNGIRGILGDRLTEFLHAVDFLERQQPQGGDCISALADHIADTRGPAKVAGFVQALSGLGADYMALCEVLATPPQDAFEADIWRLQLFKWSQWRPLALLWFSDYRRARNSPGAGSVSKIAAAQRRFDALHKRCMGLVLAGFSSADRETIFARAVAQAKVGANPLSTSGALAFKDVQLTRVSDGLRLPITDQEIRSTLLRWTESMLAGPVPPAHVRECTVEHILPRRPAPQSSWVVDFKDLDTRYLACHALGNLAALDRVRNEKIRNATFAEKRPVFADAARDFKTVADLADVEVWSAEAIEARTLRLANAIELALDLPVSAII